MRLGLVDAAVAALAYGGASVLQAQGVAAGQRLLSSPRYLGGLGLDLVGFGATALALRTEPLFLVQSAVAGSIGVTALLARIVLGHALPRLQAGALVGLGLGLVLMAASAQSTGVEATSPAVRLSLLAGVPLLALAVFSASAGPTRSGVLLAALAGLAGGAAGVCARELVVPDTPWRLLLDPAVVALAAYGAVCAWGFAEALRTGAVTVVTATCFAVSTLVPAVVGVALLGDRTRTGWGLGAAVGVLAVLGATSLLARSAALEPA